VSKLKEVAVPRFGKALISVSTWNIIARMIENW